MSPRLLLYIKVGKGTIINKSKNMEEEIEESMNNRIRRVYEPRYGRRLSDEEVHEIRTNLRTFAEAIIAIDERLHNKEKK